MFKMKPFKIFIFMIALSALFSHSQCAEKNVIVDEGLPLVLKEIKDKAARQKEGFCMVIPVHPTLPTREDIERFEAALFQMGWKLPAPLKDFYLGLGNLDFYLSFPTIHPTKGQENYSCQLLDFIREGHERGIPAVSETAKGCWFPFCQDGSDIISMELQTGVVCRFSFDLKCRKEKPEYPNLSSFLRATLLR